MHYPPLISAYLIFGSIVSLDKLRIPEASKVSFVDPKSSPTKELSEAMFGRSEFGTLGLLCLVNNNEVALNGIKIKLPFDADPEAGAMEAKVNSSKSIYAPINNWVKFGCGIFFKNISEAELTFRRPKPEVVPSVVQEIELDQPEFKGKALAFIQDALIDTTNSYFVKISSPLGAYTLFFLGWVTSLIAIIESIKLMAKSRKIEEKL